MVDGKLNLNGLDKDTLEALAGEFEFYSIDVPEALSNAITPPAPPVKWVRHDGDVLITNGGNSVTNITEDGDFYSRVYGEEPCNRFSNRIDNRGLRGEMRVGFCEKDPNTGVNLRKYWLWLQDGKVISWIPGEGYSEPRDYTTPPVDGDVITVIREGSTIIFMKNGVSLGEAFTNVPEDTFLHPFVSLVEKHQQITSLPTPAF